MTQELTVTAIEHLVNCRFYIEGVPQKSFTQFSSYAAACQQR